MTYHRYPILAFTERHDSSDHALLKVVSHFGCDSKHWIAGGAIRAFLRNKPIATDVDFFFSSEEAFNAFVGKHATKPTLSTEHQSTWTQEVDGEKLRIQAIKIAFYDSPLSCIDSFDYTICQFAIDGDEIVCSDMALWDLGNNRLVVHKVTFPVATVNRLVKYRQQGFGSCSGTVTSILKAVIDNPSLLDANIRYID